HDERKKQRSFAEVGGDGADCLVADVGAVEVAGRAVGTQAAQHEIIDVSAVSGPRINGRKTGNELCEIVDVQGPGLRQRVASHDRDVVRNVDDALSAPLRGHHYFLESLRGSIVG